MNGISEILITGLCAYIPTHYISVYWYKNFPNRKFITIKNKLLFKILGGSFGERGRGINYMFYPEQKITLTGFLLYIFNILILVAVLIFPMAKYYYRIYTITYLIFAFLIQRPLECEIYKRYNKKLPKKIYFIKNKSGFSPDIKTDCKSIYKYSNEILIDKEKQYYIFVENTINFSNIGLLKLEKSGEVIELAYKSRKEIDKMWETHIRFYSYFKDRKN